MRSLKKHLGFAETENRVTKHFLGRRSRYEALPAAAIALRSTPWGGDRVTKHSLGRRSRYELRSSPVCKIRTMEDTEKRCLGRRSKNMHHAPRALRYVQRCLGRRQRREAPSGAVFAMCSYPLQDVPRSASSNADGKQWRCPTLPGEAIAKYVLRSTLPTYVPHSLCTTGTAAGGSVCEVEHFLRQRPQNAHRKARRAGTTGETYVCSVGTLHVRAPYRTEQHCLG